MGEATATKIVAGRPYGSVDDLAKAGVSKGTIEKLRSGAMVSGASAAARPPAPSPGPPPAAAPSSASTPVPAPAETRAPAAPAATAAAPAAPAPKASSSAKLAPGQKININTATKDELILLPDIGPTTAGPTRRPRTS